MEKRRRLEFGFVDLTNNPTKMAKGNDHDDDDGSDDEQSAKKKKFTTLRGERITKDHLSEQDPVSVPKDWDTPGLYHPVCISIWTQWLVFVRVIINMRTKDESSLHLVPPELPWTLKNDLPVVFLLVNYMPTNLTNLVKGSLHPASAERSNGLLRSCCWQLINQSIGPVLYKHRCGKANFTPFAFPYNGESTDIFSDEDVRTIMAVYRHFLHHVFLTVGSTNRTGRTLLCSQAVLAQVMSLFGGKKAFCVYVKEHPWAFFSVPTAKINDIKTSVISSFFSTSCT